MKNRLRSENRTGDSEKSGMWFTGKEIRNFVFIQSLYILLISFLYEFPKEGNQENMCQKNGRGGGNPNLLPVL